MVCTFHLYVSQARRKEPPSKCQFVFYKNGAVSVTSVLGVMEFGIGKLGEDIFKE